MRPTFIAFTGRDKLEVAMAIVESDDRDRVANSRLGASGATRNPLSPGILTRSVRTVVVRSGTALAGFWNVRSECRADKAAHRKLVVYDVDLC